jgi:hypothetical protein
MGITIVSIELKLFSIAVWFETDCTILQYAFGCDNSTLDSIELSVNKGINAKLEKWK